ncbi:MAG: helix-turn-helix transcriptional regulator [Clostridia bacterium]|nr:helix-turn-helix transcriptional regulator [Clostridia bacterium]
MDIVNELDFLRDVLKKCRLFTVTVSPEDKADETVDSWLGAIIGARAFENVTVQSVIGNIEDNTKYKFTNEFRLQYIFMKLPTSDEKNILLIGPYLSFPLTANDMLETGEKLSLDGGRQKKLKEYYDAVPVISENDRIFTVIDTFCERIWQTPSFSILELSPNFALSVSSLDTASSGNSCDELLADMEKMEMRYSFENELIRAVALGQQHKEKLLLSSLSEQMFERRLQDPVRNAKNYCIIMNTILRKAAEQGGVHPLYIDKTSSMFASKIEQITETKTVPTLMSEIFTSYCRLVRKHATKKYSPVVKKTLLMIDADISAELSLGVLAKKQGITTGYLATVFKKETQKTVSEYIRDRRINHALYLLNTTDLQIQTVAMHCGIMDVQYFSKIFKKQIGKTPKEYRNAIRR